jgi:hypothetical protein
MRVALQFCSGKTVWTDAEDGMEEPLPTIAVPQQTNKGFVNRVFEFFGTMHTPNQNSYLLYVEHQTGRTQ